MSNGLSSADRADGGAGNDSLYAELVSEFVGAISGSENIDIQPRIKNIETLEFEARDIAQNAPLNFDIQDLLGNRLDDLGFVAEGILDNFDDVDIGGFFGSLEGTTGLNLTPSEQLIAGILDGWQRDIVVDAKNITGHDFLGSTFSDGDLMIENVNTLTSNGVARNTSDITIGMNHTDNANSDGDASDLTVYFDEDYLISGQQAEGRVFYFLLDEDAELAGNPNRLNNIDVDGIRFTIDTGNGPVEVNIESDAANTAGTHQGFVNALQDPLQALIANGTLPAGTTLTLDPTITDTTFIDDGSQSDPIPAIILTSGDGSEVIATGFSRIEEEIGEYDVYGRFNSENQVEDQPVSINIDLYKAGRGGEGGNLVIGGKDQTAAGDGIEVFYVNVKGDGPDAIVDQPSNIGTLTSTNNALREIYISTDAMDAVKDSVASLTIRDGFNELYDGDSLLRRESGDLQLVNADGFLGDLNLGTDQQIINLDMLTAQGGGDVFFNAILNGSEEDQAYNYTTAGGDDTILVEIDGDALDHAGSSLNIATGAGDDYVEIDGTNINNGDFDGSNERLNQAILDNVTIDTGSGNDTIKTVINSKGDLNINAGSGDDFIDTSGGRGSDAYADWTFNFDDNRDGDTPGTNDIAGVPTSLAYVGGATVTVILSGAGTDALGAGGGIMKTEAVNPVGVEGAIRGINGYEASATIGTLLNGNRYYGDQRDVTAAVVRAIENDPVLSKLITVTLTENNTWVATMNTGGTFAEVDLRVEISQGNPTSWTAVEDEAQQVFNNSGITVNSVASANAPTGFNLQTTYGADGVDDGPFNIDGSHLEGTDGWYTGLSARGDNNNAAELSFGGSTDGSAQLLETDNVINPGTGDDLVVMSTDDAPLRSDFLNYTPLPGNTLQNGASNETIVFETLDFGDDTIMNFTTAVTMSDEVPESQLVVSSEFVNGTEEEDVDAEQEEFVLDLTQVPTSATPYNVEFGTLVTAIPANATVLAAAAAIAGTYAALNASGFIATNNGDGTITFVADAPGGDVTPDVTVGGSFNSTPTWEATATVETTVQGSDEETILATPAEITLTFENEAIENLTDGGINILGQAYLVADGDLATDIAATVAATPPAGWSAVDNLDGTVTLTSDTDGVIIEPTVVVDGSINGFFVSEMAAPGLDFLDYSDYLTSQFDSSAGGGDSTDSNILIPVTLDYNEGNTLGGSGANFSGDGAANTNVEANEVAIVRMANDTTDGETYASLTASDVAALFNNGAGYTGFGGDASFGDLNAGNFSVQTYQKTNQEGLIGDGKAIFKVENPNNLGEYKVFELTWSGDMASASGATVSAVEIGSQDFGTSLTGLDDVNLVGSDDYADLIQNGFSFV